MLLLVDSIAPALNGEISLAAFDLQEAALSRGAREH